MITRLAASTLVAVAVSCAAAIALAMACGGLFPALARICLALGLAAAVAAWWTVPRDPERTLTAWDWAMAIAFSLAAARAFLWLIYPVRDEIRVLSPNNLGDLSLHLQFIRYMASGTPFWPESPILSGVPLMYPVGADLFNSLLLLVGVPVERGLIWTGLIGAALIGIATWRWAGAFGLAMLLFNGGLAGFLIFQQHVVRDFQATLAWKNLFLSMLVTQRGLLWALPAGLLLCAAWSGAIRTGARVLPLWVQVVLYALMPVFSVHAFLFLSLLAAAIFVLEKPQRGPMLRLVGCSFVPATAAMLLVTGRFAAGGGVRFLPGWMSDGSVFWIVNFGIGLPLLVLLPFFLRRMPEARAFVGAGLFTFVLCMLVSFAPWEWDNMKLLIWAWLACAPAMWTVIRMLPMAGRAIVCFLLFFSGAVSLVGGLDGRHGYKLIARSELAQAAHALRDVPAGDRLIVKPDYNQPAILLGRPVVCGYEGHLWSHGLNYRAQFALLQKVLAMQPGWEQAAADLHADWLYIDDSPPRLVPLSFPNKPAPLGP